MEKLNTWMLKQYIAAQGKLEAEEGQGMVEYGLILVLVSIVAVIALGAIGTNVNLVFERIRDELVIP